MAKKKIKKEIDKDLNKEKDTNTKKEIKNKHNELLFWILVCFGLIAISFLLMYFFAQSRKSIEYKDVEFTIIKEGKLTFYNTQVPIYSSKEEIISNYNFYLRTNPKELSKIEFNEDMPIMKIVVLNYSEDINCEGYGVIALTNMINLYNLIGVKVTIDKNATCSEEGLYMFINIEKYNENRIEEIGKNCYNLKIKECDIFPTTERIMLETFAKIKEKEIKVYSSALK